MMRQISFALVSLGLSTTVLAGMPSNTMVVPTPAGINLIAPDSTGAWTFGLEALYVQPTGSNFQYARVNNSSASVNKSTNYAVDPSFAWGWAGDITYHFAGNSRDVMLGYTHVNSDDNDSLSASGSESISPPDFAGESLADDPNQATADSDYHYDAVDLVFGQQITIGQHLLVHPFGGLRYARVKLDNSTTESDTTDSTNSGSASTYSDFNGIGPRAGANIKWLTNCGLSVVGSFAGSLLVGETDSSAKIRPSAASASDPANWSVANNENVVPELDASLGLQYTIEIEPQAALALQIGYQAVEYFNVTALDSSDLTTPNSVNNRNDFGYYGPYLRLQLNVA